MSQQSIFDELNKLNAEIYDYQFGLVKELFVFKEPEIDKKARIKPRDLKKYLPVADLKWGNQERIKRDETFYIEVTGSYFPDFLEENQLYFISAGLAEYLTGKIDLETVLFYKVVFYCRADGRIEEYYLLIPEEYDCIREGSVRYDNQAVSYLEIDMLRLGDAEIFKVKGFPHLIVSVKLDRFNYGYEYIRLENYFDYEGERDRNYQERADRRSLEEALRLFDWMADAAGMIDYINTVRSACDLELITRELRDGLEKIFNSLQIANQQTGRCADNFLLFGWSERSRLIQLRNDRDDRFSFGENQFELPSYQKLAEVCAKLPEGLRQSAQTVAWEVILYCLTLAGETFGRQEKIHNQQRFRLYICRDDDPPVNPPLFYDFKSHWQLEVETARDLSGFDLNDRDLREYHFNGQNFSGVKVVGGDFRKAKFNNCILTKAEFWNCNFTGAEFQRCNLEESRFDGNDLGKTRFSAVNLKNALLKENDMFQAALIRTDLSGVKLIQDLSGAYFEQCKLSGAVVQTLNYMYQTVFRLCDLRDSRFDEVSLSDRAAPGGVVNSGNKLMELVKCDFTNSDLRGSKFAVDRLTGVRLIGTKLIDTDFSECNAISASDFQWSSCAGMNLGRLRLEGNNFTGVNLALLKPRQGAVFSNNDFSNANLAGYDFTVGGYSASNNMGDANLTHCRLDGADLTTSNIRSADFQGALLKNACFTKKQLTETELSIKQKNEIQIVCDATAAEGGNTAEVGVKRTEAELGG
jgi:uncharacterized protein YjbI with pentapeptide repeats